MRKREGFRSPVREYRTPGSLAGLMGDCQSYATHAIALTREGRIPKTAPQRAKKRLRLIGSITGGCSNPSATFRPENWKRCIIQILRTSRGGWTQANQPPVKPVRFKTVVKAWVENPYYQYFTGETVFQWKFPVAPSDMVYFRERIGTEGLERILAATIKVHGESALEEDVIVDTTVQEKNITHPTDVKLYSRVIESCWRIADKEDIPLAAKI